MTSSPKSNLSIVVTGLNLILALAAGALLLAIYLPPGSFEGYQRLLQPIVDLDVVYQTVVAFVAVSIVGLLFFIAYFKSFDSEADCRPRKRVFLIGLAPSFVIASYYGATHGNEIFTGLHLPIALALLLALPWALVQLEKAAGNLSYSIARRAFDKGMFGMSSPFCRIAGNLYPESQNVRRLAGLATFRAGRYGVAKRLLKSIADPSDPNSDVLHYLAILHEKDDEWSEAIFYYSELSRRQPEHRGLLRKLSELNLKTGRVDEAIVTFEKLHDYENLEFLDQLENLYVRSGDFGKALKICGLMEKVEKRPFPKTKNALRSLLESAPIKAPVLMALAEMAFSINDTKEGIKHLEEVVENRPDDRETRKRLVQIYEDTLQFPKIEPHIAALIDSGDTTADLLETYIELLLDHNSYVQATPHLSRARELYPEDYRFAHLQARLHFENKEFEAAKEALVTSSKLCPQKPPASLSALRAKVESALLEKKLEELGRRVANNPEDEQIVFEYAELLAVSDMQDHAVTELDNLLIRRPDKKERVLEVLQGLIEKIPENFRLYNFLADLRLKEKRFDEVLEIFQKISEQSLHPQESLKESCEYLLKQNPKHEGSIRLLAQLMEKAGKWERVVEQLEKLQSLNSELDADALRSLVLAYCRTGSFAKTEPLAETALQKFPSDIVLLNEIAKLYWNNERFTEAYQFFLRARALDPNDVEVRRGL
ncbi:MAG: hypothetical protein V2A74_04730, partial [bacterium]